MNPKSPPSSVPTKANAPTAQATALVKTFEQFLFKPHKGASPTETYAALATIIDRETHLPALLAVVEAAERAGKAHYDWWHGETSKPNFHAAMQSLNESVAAYRAAVGTKP